MPDTSESDEAVEKKPKKSANKREPRPLVLQSADQINPSGHSANQSFPPPHPQVKAADSSAQTRMGKRALSTMPPPPHPQAHPAPSANQQYLPKPTASINIGRRVSLANGEAANIDAWAAKHMAPGGLVSEEPVGAPPNRFVKSPAVLKGSAGAARRSSGPYPAPVPALGINTSGQSLQPQTVISAKVSPISPSVRPMPSALHLTAMRNNSRRASMPGAAQARLISSGPFVPPRVVSTFHQVAAGSAMIRPMRELSPIRDHDTEAVPAFQRTFPVGETDFSTTYLTPLSSTYLPNSVAPTAYFPVPFDVSSQVVNLFAPNAPLPNPAFSFGSPAEGWQVSPTDEDLARSPAMFLALQDRNRVDSITSVNTYTTESGNTAGEGSDFGASDWAQIAAGHDMGPEAFASDNRRASA